MEIPVSPSSAPIMTKRLKILLTAVTLTLLLAATLGDQAANQLTAYLLLRQSSSDDHAVRDVVETAGNPAKMLQRFWATKKVPHRYAVMRYLSDLRNDSHIESETIDTILADAIEDPDHSVRELALGVLLRRQSPHFLPAIRRQFHDVDQDMKLRGLHYLRNHETPAMVPELIRLLDDAEPMVVTAAAGVLRLWTQADFGVRSHDAIAKPNGNQPREVPEANLQRIAEGVAGWKSWWAQHRDTYPPLPPAPDKTAPPSHPNADFQLVDLDGKSVSLSAFRGKTVLLNFWTTWCTACASEIPDLVALQESSADAVTVLGISLDGSDDHGHDHPAFIDVEDGKHLNSPDHDHEHSHDHESSTTAADLKRIQKKIRRTIERKGINYRILLNPKGDIGNRYNGHELPTNVLIDPEGRLRRRFIGSRPLENWKALINELQSAPN